MAYAYRYHANSGPTRVNRTSWGPSSAHTPIDIPNKMYEKRLSGNFDRIINSFDRTNAFECVRSAFEQACSKTTKESVQQNGAAFKNGDDKTADCVDSSAGGKHVTIPKNNGMFERQIEENEKKDRFTGHADIVVNGKGHGGLGSSYDRADVGLASKQTPCTDEDVTAYYQDRIYMSQARQLYPLQEDLADWINKTIGITYLTGDNFLQVLDNGVALCQLAKVIRDKTKEAFDRGLYTGVVPHLRGKCWQQAARKSFFSRDNMENFINFCRQLGIHENLLFESDDLVLHAQPRNVILCLLELGRIASRVGVEPPGLVQFEKEIALEEEGATATDSMTTWQFRPDGPPDIFSSDEKVDPPPSPIEKEVSLPAALFAESEETPSVHTDDTWSRGTPEDLDSTNVKPLSELDKRVQIVTRLMQRNCNCSEGRCSKLLKVRKVGEGRYNIAGRNVFIRLLKGRHMMVRVGGGWDTLEHFLTRHDPCQVRVISPHSSSAGQKVTTVNLVRQSPANSTHSINSVGTNNTDKSSDRLSIANSDISPGERSETSNDRSKKRTSVSSIGTKPFKYNSDDSCIETLSSDGKISSNSSKHSAEESCSETSSINGSTPHSIVKQMDTIKKYLATGKTPSTPVRMRSASTSKSSSGRTTPLSCGKISPNVKTTKTSILSERMNGKMSPAGLKLDLTPCNKASVNNRLDSPVDSTRLLSASRANRTLRSSNENRKSMPSALNVSGDLAMRRRSVNIPLTSAKPLKSPNPKSPLHPKSPSKLASSRSNSLTPIFSLKSPVKPVVSSRSNSLTPVAINKSLVSPSSIEKSVRMALPKQDSENKPFLHIRAKYRSPPPRDVPPR